MIAGGFQSSRTVGILGFRASTNFQKKFPSISLQPAALHSMELLSWVFLNYSEICGIKRCESGTCLCDKTTSVPKNNKKSKEVSDTGTNVFQAAANIKAPKLSLLWCISAAGEEFPPLILVPVQRAKKRDSYPPAAVCLGIWTTVK